MLKHWLKQAFWKLPISDNLKNKIAEKRFQRMLKAESLYDNEGRIQLSYDPKINNAYIKQIVQSYGEKSKEYQNFLVHDRTFDTEVFAYYLTQFHPNPQNDDWWGKGTTEWNNVNQAIPQYVGHYQPRKPGELGYYDLRLKENLRRQIELANNYGITGFCFYYYWFDGGKRLLEMPLNLFLKNKDLEIDFFYCWANENWTKKFSGINDEVLMGISDDEEMYIKFIDSVIEDMNDSRYKRIDNKPMLSIYRPSKIPNCDKVILAWRNKAKRALGTDIYLIAVQEKGINKDWMLDGFDAMTEFQPKQALEYSRLAHGLSFIRKDFSGEVYDFEDLVNNKRYLESYTTTNLYPAVMPMWDNTARRNFRGIIFHGSTPQLYKHWLLDAIRKVKKDNAIKNIVFVNAWNEWGEGTYLEPDSFYGYAYLEATYQALEESER